MSHLTHRTLFLVATLSLTFAAGVPLASGKLATGGCVAEREQRKSGENDFLLFGTVFTDRGFVLPGSEIRVRRAGQRKARWSACADRRGEFAVRVPRGAEYEMTISARGFQEQTRWIDARTGNREDLVLRLAPASGGKTK